jgi:hypothetical protein
MAEKVGGAVTAGVAVPVSRRATVAPRTEAADGHDAESRGAEQESPGVEVHGYLPVILRSVATKDLLL